MSCESEHILIKFEVERENPHVPVDILTHPVFIIHHIQQHIVQVQDAPVAMFQPVDLDPVAGILHTEIKK